MRKLLELLIVLLGLLCASVCQGAVTYKFVDGDLGTGDNDGTSWANAWRTIIQANGVAADTTVLVASGTTYTAQDGATDSCLSVTANGTIAGPVTFQGDDESGGAGPGNLATFTLDADTNALVNAALIPNHTVFVGCRFTGASADGAECGVNDNIMFRKCTFDNNDALGLSGDNYITAISCTFHTNNYGADVDNAVRFIGCEFYNNTSGSIQNIASGLVLFNVFREHNDITMFRCDYTSTYTIIGNVFHGENSVGTGVDLDDAGIVQWPIIMNNVFYDLKMGIQAGTDINGGRHGILNNHFNSNTADTDAEIEEGFDTQTDPPVFKSEATSAADDTVDYSPDTGSPLIDNGLDGGDV